MGKKRKPAEELLKAVRKREQQKQKNPQPRSNAEKAKQLQPKLGELPAKHVMDAIAESDHDAVTSVFDDLEKAGLVPPPATDTERGMRASYERLEGATRGLPIRSFFRSADLEPFSSLCFSGENPKISFCSLSLSPRNVSPDETSCLVLIFRDSATVINSSLYRRGERAMHRRTADRRPQTGQFSHCAHLAVNCHQMARVSGKGSTSSIPDPPTRLVSLHDLH
jgi:hypothetical protein